MGCIWNYETDAQATATRSSLCAMCWDFYLAYFMVHFKRKILIMDSEFIVCLPRTHFYVIFFRSRFRLKKKIWYFNFEHENSTRYSIPSEENKNVREGIVNGMLLNVSFYFIAFSSVHDSHPLTVDGVCVCCVVVRDRASSEYETLWIIKFIRIRKTGFRIDWIARHKIENPCQME